MQNDTKSGRPAAVDSAAMSTVYSLFAAQARLWPERIALATSSETSSYSTLLQRVNRVAALLRTAGIERGDRIALLSENRREYLEVTLAAAQVGAAVACQNWRLTTAELAACIELVEPSVVFASPEHAPAIAGIGAGTPIVFGADYESRLVSEPAAPTERQVQPEDPLLLLYTSGTTGLPKAAVISHRAQIVRNLVTRAEFGLAPEDSFVAWSPLYHMGAMDNSLGTLMVGGKVIIVNGFDAEQLADIVSREQLGWLLLMPGMVGRFSQTLRDRQSPQARVKVCGVMADLVPRHEIAEVTRLLNAPYANTFGATETGCPPCSSSLIAVGTVPVVLSKRQSPFCEVKLVDADDQEVAPGSPGELCMRGPTLFSGYFRADAVNAEDFRGGWFHMGDVFKRNPDGSLDFVDRVKYLIKSGGENIYPAEIENVLLSDPGVEEAVVVRQRDERWGEVPVAFVARRTQKVTAAQLSELCQRSLARYKQPKAIEFIALSEFPRSASGKVQRHELEGRLLKGHA